MLALLAQALPEPAPAVQWSVLGLLAAVLTAVGLQVRVEMAAKEARLTACQERADKRSEVAEAERKAESERNLLTQERILAALFQAAQSIAENTEQGRETNRLLIQMEALLR